MVPCSFRKQVVLGLESYKYKYGSQGAEVQEAHFQFTLQGVSPGGGAVLQAAVIHTVSVKPEIATKHGAVEEKFE